MSNQPRWIRTVEGWAGRRGYIMRTEQGNVCKFMYIAYGGKDILYSDRISELKKLADQE